MGVGGAVLITTALLIAVFAGAFSAGATNAGIVGAGATIIGF